MKAAIRTTYRPKMEALLLQLPEASGAGLELQGVGLVLLQANQGLRQVWLVILAARQNDVRFKIIRNRIIKGSRWTSSCKNAI